MGKIVCPKCGEVHTYHVTETVRRRLIFDSDDKCIDSAEAVISYGEITKRCNKCGSRVKVYQGE